MSKQTAVEWLEEQYQKQITFLHREDFEQAKEMEEQQIKDAWIDCKREYTVRMDCYPPQYIVNESNQYYEKKFKNK